RLHRTALQSALADGLHVLAALTDVDGDGHHLGTGLLGDPTDRHRGVEPARVREHHPLSHLFFSSLTFVSAFDDRCANAVNRSANSLPVNGSLAITAIVSTPAKEPTTTSRSALSMALARNWSPPGGVRNTMKMPDASAETMHSTNSINKR